MDSNTTFRMNPFPATIFAPARKNQDVVPAGAIVIHQKSKISGKKLRFIDRRGILPLA